MAQHIESQEDPVLIFFKYGLYFFTTRKKILSKELSPIPQQRLDSKNMANGCNIFLFFLKNKALQY